MTWTQCTVLHVATTSASSFLTQATSACCGVTGHDRYFNLQLVRGRGGIPPFPPRYGYTAVQQSARARGTMTCHGIGMRSMRSRYLFYNSEQATWVENFFIKAAYSFLGPLLGFASSCTFKNSFMGRGKPYVRSPWHTTLWSCSSASTLYVPSSFSIVRSENLHPG